MTVVLCRVLGPLGLLDDETKTATLGNIKRPIEKTTRILTREPRLKTVP
jgi:hypothetical protein